MKGSRWTYAKSNIFSIVYMSMRVPHMYCTRKSNEAKIVDNNSDVVLLKR
jgi:hypothetical protein